MICHVCGKENEENARYCGNCGQKLIDPAAAMQNAGAQPAADPLIPEADDTAADEIPQHRKKKKWPIVLIVIIAAVAVAAVIGFMLTRTTREEKWQAQYQLGEQYLTEENYEQAVVAFTEAIEIDPEETEAYLGRADAYMGMGDDDSLEAALDDCRTVIDLDVTETQAYLSASRVCIIREDYEEARNFLDDGLEQDPDNEDLTDQYDEVDNLEKAERYEAYYDKLMELQDTYGEAVLKMNTDEYGTTFYWTGMFFAKLVDFDGDGQEELVSAVYDGEDVNEEYNSYSPGYNIQVWAFSDGEAQEVYLQDTFGFSETGSGMELSECSEIWYIISGYFSGDGALYEYYAYDSSESTFTLVKSFDAWTNGTDCLIDGEVVEEDTFYSEEEAWEAEISEEHVYYFTWYDWYLDEDEGADPVSGELQDTLDTLLALLPEQEREREEEEETQSGVLDEEAFSEVVSGANVLYYLVDDYDGDGEEEAFGITGNEPDEAGFSNYNAIYFISSDGSVTCIESDTYGYLSTEDELIEAGSSKFMVWEVCAGSSGTSIILGVRDGEYYEPAISRRYEFFDFVEDTYIGLTADWSEDWHDYDVNVFDYDDETGEFTLVRTQDYDYDTEYGI